MQLGVATIVIGHVVFNSAYATMIIQARLATLARRSRRPRPISAPRPWRAFRRVTLPLLMPAVIVAALLTFTFSFDNVVTSLFLGGHRRETLPVLMLGLIRLHVTPEVNAIGMSVMMIDDRARSRSRRVWRERAHGGRCAVQRGPGREDERHPDVVRAARRRRRWFGRSRAVDGIDLEIGEGEFFSLIGPSGCGKTTTLRMIAGLEEPTDGPDRRHGRDDHAACRRTGAR